MPRPLLPVKNPGIAYVVAVVLVTPRAWPPVARFLGTVWRDFFWPQYRLRWFKRDRPIHRVDAAIDDTIPFRRAYYPQYLSFVSLWIETLGFVRAAVGGKSMALWLAFLAELDALYRDAGSLSRELPTTTRRPPGASTLRMALIKAFDPHYHCLPSLHILIVMHTRLKFREWLPALEAAGMGGEGGGARLWAARLRRESLEIAESVLYTKQHSVSCIAASLFLLTARDAAADEDFAEEVIASLFEAEDADSDVPAEAIRDHIRGLYRKFLRRQREDGVDARTALVDYIMAQPVA